MALSITSTVSQVLSTLSNVIQRTMTAAQMRVAGDTTMTELSTILPQINTANGQINTVVGDMNSLSTYMNGLATNAASSETVALAASNFVGEYSGLSGSKTAGISTYHLSKWWILLSDVADITTKVPGTDSEWAALYADWEDKSIDFTAVVNCKYRVAAGKTATLPAAPNDKDEIRFATLGDMGADPGSIARNGKTIMGLSEDMDWTSNMPFTLVYYSTGGDWRFG